MSLGIPKKIHYCWFGNNELPPLAQKCIESWKKYCPDYEIIEWNESNFKIDDSIYAAQAYEAKKWAFVSDYARFKILYQHGGLYFDTDVELIAPIDDIVEKGAFMAREDEHLPAVAPGLCLGTPAGDPLYKAIIDEYENMHFINPDGSQNLKTVVDYTSELLIARGLKTDNEIQVLEGVCIYPKEYFCPMDYVSGEICITDNTRSIHHYSASWHNEKEKYAFILQRKYAKHLPRRISCILARFVATTKYDGFFAALAWVFKR